MRACHSLVALLLLAVLPPARTHQLGATGAVPSLRRRGCENAPCPLAGAAAAPAQPPAAILCLRGGGNVLTMAPRTAWLVLFSATVFELFSTYFMNKAQGFTKPLPSFFAVLFYAASFYGFNVSLRGIEISVAYAVWSAIVMAALAAIGMTVLGESVTASKIAGIAAIIVGTGLLSRDMVE